MHLPLQLPGRSGPRHQARHRLSLECLEDRIALSTSSPLIDLGGLTVSDSHVNDQILVQYQQGATPTALPGTTLGRSSGLISGLYEVKLDEGQSVESALSAYRSQPGVLRAEADYHLTTTAVPNDSRFGEQWALNSSARDINAARAWDVTAGSPRIVVSVMDTGVDYTHADLYMNIWINQGEIPSHIRSRLTDIDSDGLITFRDLNDSRNQGSGKIIDVNRNGRIDGGDLLARTSVGGWADGISNDGDQYVDDIIGWNTYDNNNNPMDTAGHGTHVAGTIAAVANNRAGVAGVAYNSRLMPVKFIGANGGSIGQFVAALEYAVAKGAKISNNSWTGAGNSQLLIDAISAARGRGHIFVAAAGNNSSDNDRQATYPANFDVDNVVSVAATDRNGNLASFSNYGDQTVHIAAPGVDILSTARHSSYASISGTSMAAPHVTGTLALVWAKNPSWTYTQVIAQVLGTVERSSALSGKVSSGGLLNAAAAVGVAQAASVSAPRITGSQWISNAGTNLSAVRVTFDRAMQGSTFTTVDASLTGPGGRSIGISSVRQVGTDARVFDVVFMRQTQAGSYTLRVGPNVRDTRGVNMTSFTGTYSVGGSTTPSPTPSAPRITGSQWISNAGTNLSAVRVTFDRAMQGSTFTTVDASLTGPGGRSIGISSVRQVGTDARVFDVVFMRQTQAGSYTLRVGPNVRSTTGVNMTSFTGTYSVGGTTTSTAPRITTSQWISNAGTNLNAVRVTFDQPVQQSTFTTVDASLTGPGGRSIGISSVRQVGTDARVFDVVFLAQTQAGTYSLRIGPNVRNAVGVNMVSFTRSFTVGGNTTPSPTPSAPRITGSQWISNAGTNLSAVRVTFDRAMQGSTFTTVDASLTGPGGRSIGISSVRQVGTDARVFDVVFMRQTQAGSYTLRVGPNVRDTRGVNMTSFTGTYSVGGSTTPSPTPSAPRITGSQWISNAGTNLSAVRVTFDRAMQGSTFTTVDASLTGPGGRSIGISSVRQVGTDARVFDVVFMRQTQAGSYTLRVGPNVRSTTGVNMTSFTGTYSVSTSVSNPLRVISSTAIRPSTGGINAIRVTFDRAVQASTFTTADVVLTGPGGRTVSVSSVRVVSDRVFDIVFPTQTIAGTYTLRVGPNVKDTAGRDMTTFQGQYQVSSISSTTRRTYTSSTPATINPNGRAVTLLTINDDIRIGDLNVKLNITHPRLNDLYIHLQGPDGTNVLLFNRMGGTTANLVETVFDDEAGTHIALGRGPFTGSYVPLSLLNVFDGKLAKGTWKLWVEDRGGVNRGTLNNWSLIITPRA